MACKLFVHYASKSLYERVEGQNEETAVNSGLRAGVIRQLQRKYGEHINWCLSHRLELAIKDVLKKDMEEIDTAMRDLFYTYQNSGKRLRELRALYEILKDVYEFRNGEVKPAKSTGTSLDRSQTACNETFY